MKRITKKDKRRIVFKFLFFIVLSCFTLMLTFNNVIKITEKTKEKKELLKKLDNLKEEEVILSDDVEKLKDPEYAARYAREKYLYSKNGEKILKID